MAGLLASIETLQSPAETVEPPRRLGVTGQDIVHVATSTVCKCSHDQSV